MGTTGQRTAGQRLVRHLVGRVGGGQGLVVWGTDLGGPGMGSCYTRCSWAEVGLKEQLGTNS